MAADPLAEPGPESAVSRGGRRVLIDALATRFGGAAYATIQLSRHLAQRPEVATVTVLARHGSIVERGLADEPTVRCAVLRPARRFELIRRTAWQAVRLRRLVAQEQCDVLISMSGILPRSPGCHLMCLIGNPVMYERSGPANMLRRRAVRRTARAAQYLAAPSRLMAELVSGSAERPCEVLPWGIDHCVFSPPAQPGREILCVADFYAHKRHDLVLAAWRLLPSPRPRLRLVGNPAVDTEAYARLLARVGQMPEVDSIVLENRVPLARLVDAYRSARVFVMASEHESFCMPLAESMACGVPAVARDVRSLRETGGAGAMYVAGDDPSHWAAAIQRMIEDKDAHARTRQLALQAAAQFSWDACAGNLAVHL
jgi:glycosyltransferase involved in cell wall biosynthesis